MAEITKTTIRKQERSVAYPGVSLGDAVQYAAKLKESLGSGPYSREEAARAMGHVKLTGPAARKVAALAHYGLLERTGSVYRQSKLALVILAPVSDIEKENAIKQAAVTPRLFQKLCEKFNNQALPTLLSNILAREGIGMKVSEEVANIFRETMEFAGLLVNGVLTVPSIAFRESEENIDKRDGTLPSYQEPVKESSKPAFEEGNIFKFQFTGGIQLMIPMNDRTSEAIVDGELKEARKALTEFSEKFLTEEKRDNSVEI